LADGAALRRAAAAQVLVDDPDDPLLTDADRHHLVRVLRLGPDERFVVTDGRGRWRLCHLTHRGPDGAFTVAGPVEFEPAPAPALTVGFVPVKGERPEWVVQKLTEVGIDRIVVLASSRGVVRWDTSRASSALQRLAKVAAAAACQSRRVWLPEVQGVVALAELVARVGAPELHLAEPGGQPVTTDVTTVAIGPEGGWDPGELAHGCPTVGLGPTVLRAETAALAAGAVMCALRSGTVVATTGTGVGDTSDSAGKGRVALWMTRPDG